MAGKPQIIVAQIGARHHYAIPRMLQKSGHLVGFHTDANGVKGLGKILGMIPGTRGGRLGKLIQRIPHGVPVAKIRQTDDLLKRRIKAALKLGPEPKGYIEDDHRFDEITASWGFEGADTLYAMQKHGTKLLETARAEGVRTVVDVFITPVAHRITEAEREKFPDIEAPLGDTSLMEQEDERNRLEIDQADLLLCPGHNVVRGLAEYPNAIGKAAAVVPYGSGVSFEGRRNKPVKGRILFAGTADLRKGIHYLGMAAKELAVKGYDFRVAGNVGEEIRNHPLMSHLNFLGRIPREEMMEEFLNADTFVLPTLAEGCASVVHEAVMARCPVITTAASGTLVDEDQGGVIVPERNAEALAEAISSLVDDREKRDHLASSCDSLAGKLTEESWSERLMTALQDPSPKRIQAGGAMA